MEQYEALALALKQIDGAIDQFNQDRNDWAERDAENNLLGKHLDSVEEIHAAPADDLIRREYVIREIDRRIAFWTQKLNPNSAWYQGDIIKLATLRQLREFVNELEGA